MYTMDLSHVDGKRIYDLGDRFSGCSPDGRRIGFTNYYMTADGKPFFGISGEMHFARVSPDQWEDSVVKMKCGGINIMSSGMSMRRKRAYSVSTAAAICGHFWRFAKNTI